MLPLDQFCPPVSKDHVFEASPDRRSVIFSANGATWSYLFAEGAKTKKIADFEVKTIRYLDKDSVILVTEDDVAMYAILTVKSFTEKLYDGVVSVASRVGKTAWILLDDGTSRRIDSNAKEVESVQGWVITDPDCRVIGHFINDAFHFSPSYTIERPWSDYVTSRITPDGRAVEVTFATHDWTIETIQIAAEGKKAVVNRVLHVTIPQTLVQPYLTVDRASGVPAFVYGFDTEMFEPKTISLHKAPGITVITQRLTSSKRVRSDVDILDKSSVLMTIESLISDKRSSLSVPSSRSGNGMSDKLLPVPVDTPMWAAPGFILTGEVVSADGQKISYILHGFGPANNPSKPTVVVIGDEATLSGRFSPTASAVLRAGYNLLVVRPAIRYEKQGFGTVSNISVNDAAYDVDDVLVHLQKTGKITTSFMIGERHSADTAVVLASIVDSSVTGIITIDAPLNTLLMEQSKPVGCNIMAIELDSRSFETMDRFERIVRQASGKRVKRTGSILGWTHKTYGSLRRHKYDNPGENVIRDIFQFISMEAHNS